MEFASPATAFAETAASSSKFMIVDNADFDRYKTARIPVQASERAMADIAGTDVMCG